MFPDRRSLVLVVAALAFPFGLGAQMTFTLTQTPNVFPAPTVANYDAGLIQNATGIVFTVDQTGGPANADRTTTVSVRASSGTLGGGKPLSDLEWRRADLGNWSAMTTSDVVIESRPIHKNKLNDAWSNSIFLRMHLSWTVDGPGTYSTGLVFTLTVTTP